MWNYHPLSFYTKEQIVQQQNQVKQILNAVIVVGEYTDTQGQKKKNYLAIGKLFIFNDNGMSLKLDALPPHGQSINFYPPKQKEQPNGQPQQNNQGYTQG